MISAIIPYFESALWKRDMLKKCIDSLKGDYDELIIINDIECRGMTRAVVQGCAIAHGDFLIIVSDDAELVTGSLSELTNKDFVTYPLLNSDGDPKWGPVFCIPRWIYEKAGTWDIRFDTGLGYDDDEYRFRLNALGFHDLLVESVDFIHPWGGTSIRQLEDKGNRVNRNQDLYRQIVNEGYEGKYEHNNPFYTDHKSVI